MDLKNYFSVFQRWGWIVLLCTALAGITSYWYSSQLPVVYQARSRYLIGSVLDNPNVTSNDLRASTQIGQTYDSLVNSRPVLQNVIEKLKLNTTPDQLTDQVSGTWIDTTQILSIRANANEPKLAADIANSIGDELIALSPSGPGSKQVARRQEGEAQIARLQETIRSTQAEIDQLANQIQQTSEATAQRALIIRLDERRSQLAAAQRAYSDLFQLLQTSDVNKVTLVEQAVAEPTPIAPDIQRNVLAAVIAGLVLGLAAMMLLEYFTDVIHTPEMLRNVTGLTYLGGLARHKKLTGKDGAQLVTIAAPETLAAESFRILRTNLQIPGTDRHLPSLLITSPSRGDGKTDVAANLAVSFARAGKKVILIDANLRRPQLATLFGIPEKGGLSSLFESRDRLPEPVALTSIPGLSILPAGSTSPNSSEILGSQRMYELLQTCKARADLVIIDSPSLWYSDTLALAPQVDGVLLTVSSGTTGRETTISAVESLRLVGANIIGTVLNRVKAGPAYQYYPSFAASRPALEGPTTANPVRALNSGSASTSPAQPGKSSTQSAGGALGKSQPAAPTSNNTNAKNATVVLDAMTPDTKANASTTPAADWAPIEPVATYSNGVQSDAPSDPNATRSNQNHKK